MSYGAKAISYCIQHLCRSAIKPRSTDLASISGLLCLSTTCDEKFCSVKAAVKVLLTALRYGRRVLDCMEISNGSTGRDALLFDMGSVRRLRCDTASVSLTMAAPIAPCLRACP